MKEIQLTKGMVAIVDDEDFGRVSQYKWHTEYRKNSGVFVARGYVNGQHILMHRFILGITDPKIEVDHRFGNTLDNRKVNLRACTASQNQGNTISNGGTSRFKGVSYDKQRDKWQAKIMVDYKTIHLGRFSNEVDAAKAYNDAAAKFFGEFAKPNEFSEPEKEQLPSLDLVKETSSQFIGVCWYKAGQRWTCGVYQNRKRIHVGYFHNEVDAALAYNQKAIEIFGDKAKLNQV